MNQYFLQATTRTKLISELNAHGFNFPSAPEPFELRKSADGTADAIFLGKIPATVQTGTDDEGEPVYETTYSAEWCANIASSVELTFSDKVTTAVPTQPFNVFS
jgi:hypothetical protein